MLPLHLCDVVFKSQNACSRECIGSLALLPTSSFAVFENQNLPQYYTQSKPKFHSFFKSKNSIRI